MEAYQKQKRLPIRKRVLITVLLTTVFAVFATMIISMIAMIQIKEESEKALTQQLEQNFKSLVKQKALNTDTRLEHYEKYIEFLTDYIQDMYKHRDELIASGKYIDAPRTSTPKDAFAMSGILATENMKPEDVKDDMLFFSHLETVWRPIAEGNDGLIDTVYVGTKSGFLPAYDKYSYLTAVPEGQYLYYNFKDSEWYKRGMKENGILYTGIYNDSQGRGLTITIGRGYNDTKGVRQGVCCADFDLTGIYKEMIDIDFGSGASTFALDPHGQIISPERQKNDAHAITGLSEKEIGSILNKDGILEKKDAFYIFANVSRVGWTLCSRVPRSIVLEGVKIMDRTIWTAIIASIGGLFVITLTVIAVTNSVAASITRPMEKLGEDMEMIGQGNLEHKATVIRNDEVGDIAIQLNGMVDKLKNANASLKNSQQHAEEMTVLATKDALTGIRNRTAYDKEVQQINWSIADGITNFGIVMVDMNYLKRINDIYGHEKGNIAIKKLCHIVCNVFVHSPVFRIGGDEFIVVLKNHDLEHAAALISEFNSQLIAIQDDASLEPWEKVSAAIGYAVFDNTTDTSIDNVFKRADKAMYARKKEMKAVRTD